MSDIDTKTAEDEGVLEIWTYLGRRIDSDGKSVHHVWLDMAGETRTFEKRLVGYESVGQQFSLRVVHKEDGRVSVFGTLAKFVGPHPDEGKVRTWAGCDNAAQITVDARRRAERDAKEHAPLRADLERVRTVYRKLPIPQRRALLAYVVSIITE